MRKVLFCLLWCVGCLVFLNKACADTVKLKMIVANPSDSESRTLPVKTYLPKGIKPEDVVDKGDFVIKYDFEKSLYYAYQEVTLNPQKTVTLQLSINDIWTITEADINGLKSHIQEMLQALQKTEYAARSQTLGGGILERLQNIIKAQNQPGLSIEQRISNYQINSNLLKQGKKDIGVLEDMMIDSGGMGQGNVGVLMAEENPLTIDPLADAGKFDTLKFKVEISNPSDEAKNMTLKYYLPIEATPEFIVDKGGLEAAYDYQTGVYYLSKNAINLSAHQKQEFVVEIKDLWVIPENKIQLVRARTQRLMQVLAGSDYKDSAAFLGHKIIVVLDGILAVQNDKEMSVENHIGEYRLNLQKFDEAAKDLAKLEKLTVQSGSPLLLHKIQGPQGIQSRRIEGLEGARGVEIIGKSIFRGKVPELSTTWKIIWIIIGFLAVLSFLFFILWWTQIKTSEGKKYKNVQGDHTQPPADHL
ncbi:MAG: hypothetical protein HY209_04015 [Candidatus Omnitrophica bacterium]|nr:hypothetical protein [Candidatus Omnitrophota bacterium]